MAKSSAEAEYRVMTSTANELTWMKQILPDLNFKSEEPMKMYYDNQELRHITVNFIFYERIKHIKMDYHFIRGNI
jgi:hypothetical protein